MKNIDNIVIRIESDRPIKNSDELASYWNRGGVVFESLREHGLIMKANALSTSEWITSYVHQKETDMKQHLITIKLKKILESSETER